ncbi:Spore germination protein YaaH [Thalassobacillus cyri]|uniref:Spore germination protein YaaH n=1 Tax=Thalassobacillus cyri TaxID=571932 RepID=A0A1H4HH78_9BACI|nr:LysM peptidoglycan-binding domain-containing protein [Thalassobacillus cyri]SEB21041.1 Spore germination protein YaaH [Thalassobacillus cyri]
MKKLVFSLILSILCLVPISTSHASIIYTVKKNDTLWRIAEVYNRSAKELQDINRVADPAKLLPGQSLLVPGNTYVVEPGDTLWKVANLHQISIKNLMEMNGLTSRTVYNGQRLQIPQSSKMDATIGAFFVPTTPSENKWAMNFYSNYLDSISFFEYRPDANGSLSSLHGEDSIELAWKKGMTPYATITNLTTEGFDPDLAHDLLADTKKQRQLIENIATLVHQKEYKGAIIDFESLHPKDRSNYNTFIKMLNGRLDKIGAKVGLAIPPMKGDRKPAYHAAYDYQTLGSYADFLFLMTYDWHWAGGDPGPIAPIKQVNKTLEYATSVIPGEKIYLGIAMYAYDWNLADEEYAEAYSQEEALRIAAEHASSIQYNYYYANPSFRYTDKNGDPHEVWFEDARSLLPKFRLVKKYDLKGVGGWKTGLRFPQLGYMLKEEFTIR